MIRLLTAIFAEFNLKLLFASIS